MESKEKYKMTMTDRSGRGLIFPVEIPVGRFCRKVCCHPDLGEMERMIGGKAEYIPLTKTGGLLVLAEQSGRIRYNFRLIDRIFSAPDRQITGPALLVSRTENGWESPDGETLDAFGERAYRAG